MSAKSIVETESPEQVIDDLDLRKEEMSAKIVAKKARSFEFGIVGTGAAGGKLAVCFHKLGYSCVVLNTALQDLALLDLPESNKLLLNNHSSIGGAARELSIGEMSIKESRSEVSALIEEKLADSQVNILITSLGGGSGSGSAEELVQILSEQGKGLMVIAILPMVSEDSLSKSNCIQTLSKLTKLTQDNKISNLIIIDNAKIEAIYQNVSQMNFYDTANNSIAGILDTFNYLSAKPSASKALDSMELGKLILDSGGLCTYGETEITNYEDDTAIAEAITNSKNNLLADQFNLTQAKYVGFIIVGSQTAWNKITALSINYTNTVINELFKSPKGVFKGFYVEDMPDDRIKVYSMFSGLGLPAERIDQLKNEAKSLMEIAKNKDDQRNLNLKIDTGVSETASAVADIKAKIAAKNSAFGKLMGGKTDRRK